eukprot:551129-Prymnesium_polylepis.1
MPDVPDAQGVRAGPGFDRRWSTRTLRARAFPEGASASTFSRGSLLLLDQLPPPPSSARTARTCVDHGVEHGEGGAESTVRSSDSRAQWAASSARPHRGL